MYRFLLFLPLFVVIGCQRPTEVVLPDAQPGTSVQTTRYPKVETLLSKMTLSEKIGQLNLYSSFYDVTGPIPETGKNDKFDELRSGMVGAMLNVKGVDEVRKWQKIAVEDTRLGIPLLFGYDVIHGYKVLSPIPIAESASWDLAAIQRSAAIAAKEAAAAGINWTFAPMVDISRDARWGRVMEGGGEDSYLGSKIAVARIRGLQGDDLSDPYTLAACTKHFAGYGFAEAGRDYNTVDVSGYTLHNVILPPFKATVDAGVATFMSAFNDINGVPAVEHDYLQRYLLKGKWGFDGMVVSDWGSIAETVVHGRATDLKDAAKEAIFAGCDMDMQAFGYIRHLDTLVRSGAVPEYLVDDAARRVLNLKYKLGLLDDPYRYCNEDREKRETYSESARNGVREMARKSIVLLKNEKDLLPLKAGQKIAVIGPMTEEKNSILGSWRLASDDHSGVSLREGLEVYEDYDWTFHQGVRLVDGDTDFLHEVTINETDRSGMEEAVAAAMEADIVILAMGEHGWQSGEARSRTQLGFPGLQQELMEKVYDVNPNVILLSMSGRPLVMTWAAEYLPAIVQTWQLGTESGNAIADVLTGQYNPSGRLPMTFPRDVGQIPIYYYSKSTGRPDSVPIVFWSHYMDMPNAPQFPFGYGLSYTTFQYTDLEVLPGTDDITANVTVTNTGDRVGVETAQLYIHDVAASLVRPEKLLKGFEQVRLAPGESKRITFTLGSEALGFFDNQGQYLLERGDFDIMVGANSVELLSKRVSW